MKEKISITELQLVLNKQEENTNGEFRTNVCSDLLSLRNLYSSRKDILSVVCVPVGMQTLFLSSIYEYDNLYVISPLKISRMVREYGRPTYHAYHKTVQLIVDTMLSMSSTVGTKVLFVASSVTDNSVQRLISISSMDIEVIRYFSTLEEAELSNRSTLEYPETRGTFDSTFSASEIPLTRVSYGGKNLVFEKNVFSKELIDFYKSKNWGNFPYFVNKYSNLFHVMESL